jgi:hypothetical protein
MAPPKGDDGLVHKRKVVIVKLNGKLYNSIMTHYDVVGVLHQSSDKEQVQDFIGESLFFDTRILSFHKEALRVWRSVSRY